jgi:hypothetical protein
MKELLLFDRDKKIKRMNLKIRNDEENRERIRKKQMIEKQDEKSHKSQIRYR